MRGEVYATPHYILTIISQLPEGSRYTQAYYFDHRDQVDGKSSDVAEDPELTERMDAKFWNGDRLLIAQMINALRDLTMLTGHGKWKKGSEPDFPIVGPLAWRKTSKKPATSSKDSVSDRIQKFFFGG